MINKYTWQKHKIENYVYIFTMRHFLISQCFSVSQNPHKDVSWSLVSEFSYVILVLQRKHSYTVRNAKIQTFLNSYCSERNAFLKIKCTYWENVQINVLVVTFKIPLLLMRFAGITCTASCSEIFPSCVLERWIFLFFPFQIIILSEPFLFNISICAFMTFIPHKMLDFCIKKKQQQVFVHCILYEPLTTHQHELQHLSMVLVWNFCIIYYKRT